jgi:hypothetical protein
MQRVRLGVLEAATVMQTQQTKPAASSAAMSAASTPLSVAIHQPVSDGQAAVSWGRGCLLPGRAVIRLQAGLPVLVRRR